MVYDNIDIICFEPPLPSRNAGVSQIGSRDASEYLGGGVVNLPEDEND